MRAEGKKGRGSLPLCKKNAGIGNYLIISPSSMALIEIVRCRFGIFAKSGLPSKLREGFSMHYCFLHSQLRLSDTIIAGNLPESCRNPTIWQIYVAAREFNIQYCDTKERRISKLDTTRSKFSRRNTSSFPNLVL